MENGGGGVIGENLVQQTNTTRESLYTPMGRTKGGRKTRGLSPPGPKTPRPSNSPAISTLLAKAQSSMGEMELELARGFVEQILARETDHFEAREILGIIEAEEGNTDAARAVSGTYALSSSFICA